MRYSFLVILSLFLLNTIVYSDTLTVRSGAPSQYTVQRGDTLWDITGRFFSQPWRWREIWNVNPQIKNPHLIYPGDIIVLAYDASGKPYLAVGEVKSRSLGGRNIKLSPSVRIEDLERPIDIIPIDAINQFLSRPKLIDFETLNKAAHIVGNADDRVLGGAGDVLYARNLTNPEQEQYTLIRKDKAIIDPKDPEGKAILAYKSIYLGEAKLIEYEEISRIFVETSEREILNGDRLIASSDINTSLSDFYPTPPPTPVEGVIVDIGDEAISQIAQFEIVIVNLGEIDGVVPGTVLASYRAGPVIKDKFAHKKENESIKRHVKLPDERSGILLVFKSFEKISYAIVLESTRTLKINDTVRSPE